MNRDQGLGSSARECLIKYCFERDRLQAVRKVEQMKPALAAEGVAVDLIRVSLGVRSQVLGLLLALLVLAWSFLLLDPTLGP